MGRILPYALPVALWLVGFVAMGLYEARQVRETQHGRSAPSAEYILEDLPPPAPLDPWVVRMRATLTSVQHTAKTALREGVKRARNGGAFSSAQTGLLADYVCAAITALDRCAVVTATATTRFEIMQAAACTEAATEERTIMATPRSATCPETKEK